MIKPTEQDIGRGVVYRTPYDKAEDGVLTSLSRDPKTVFVRYRGDEHSKGTSCCDLEWLIGKDVEVSP